MMVKNRGFILVLTTAIIATSVLLISLVINRVNAYRRLSTLWVDVEKARMLALGGVHIAMGQLAQLEPEKEKESKEKKEGGDKGKKDDEGKPVDILLQVLNHWQTFTFKEKKEGVEGECSLYVTSEQGKINLNKLYDFKEKKWTGSKGPGQSPAEQKGEKEEEKAPGKTGKLPSGKMLADLLTERLKTSLEKSRKKPVSFGPVLEKFFKEHPAPLDDVSQLLTVKEIAGTQEHLFMVPDLAEPLAGGAWLTDLFTVAGAPGGQVELNPLLLSRTLHYITGLQLPSKAGLEKEGVKKLADLMKSSSINWESAWEPLLSTLFGKKYTALPESLRALFTPRFEATAFSVVSYGKVGSAVQKVCALIEKNKMDTETPDAQEEKDKQPFSIKKLYWL
jgi:hypothetical protein